MQASYALGVIEPGPNPNDQVCVYAPIAWSASQLRLDPRGGLRIQHQIEFRQTGLLDGRVRTAPHDALLGIDL